jgi:hypothetical protein
MDQRTADSLFGTSNDGGADFFVPQAVSPPGPAQEVLDAGHEQHGPEAQTEIPTHNSSGVVHEEPAKEENFDPYSSLRTSGRGTTGGQTRQEVGNDPAQTNGHHASYTAGTFTNGTLQSHGQYDPYATVAHCMSTYALRLSVTLI